MKKKRIAFRVFSGNRLTIPLLLNVWEKNRLDRHFRILAVDGEPGRLTGAQLAALRGSDVCIYSFMTPHLPLIAAEVKALGPAGPTRPLLVAGGPHVTGEQELARACGFDILFRGPGEENFLRFGRDLLAAGIRARSQAGSVPGRHHAARRRGHRPGVGRVPSVQPIRADRAAAGDRPRLLLEMPLLPDRRHPAPLSRSGFHRALPG